MAEEPEVRYRLRMVSRVCAHCAATFQVKFPSDEKRFCNAKCWGASKQRPPKICEGCLRSFQLPKDFPSTTRFCSRACWHKWHRGANHKQSRRVVRTCARCSKPCTKVPSLLERTANTYCSKKCSAEAHSLHMRGLVDGTPQSSRHYQLAAWRRTRAAFLKKHPRCIKCGMLNHVHRRKFKCSLHVDHIHPRRSGGSDDHANLQPLCAPCHARKTNAGA